MRAILSVFALLSACTFAAPAQTSAPPPADFATLAAEFDYDRTIPFDAITSDADGSASATVRTLTFASPKGGRATCLLVVPAGGGPFPAVLMMPGSNQSPEASRALALELADRGAVVLVADQSQTRPGHTPLFTFTTAERDEFVNTVIDLRRAVDLLASRGDIDSSRLAFWGFSHGAFIGGLLAGIERRVTSYVLQSGAGADYLRTNAPLHLHDDSLPGYLAAIASVDPNLYIAHASPSALFLQNGTLDKTYTAAGVAAWQAAASEPKRVATYRADHQLDAAAKSDAIAWLASRIGTR